MQPIKVVLDTDIGGDIDDAWALGLLIESPELETLMVLADTRDVVYRASCCAKFLEQSGRPDIALGLGVPGSPDPWRESHKSYVGDYDLSHYPGMVSHDGMSDLIKLIEENDDLTIIGIGPFTNLGELAKTRPDLTARCRLVAMAGSIDRNHRDAPGAIAEFNVMQDINGALAVFGAPWKEIVLTPLDSCGNIVLDEPYFQKVLESPKPVAKAIIEAFLSYKKHFKHENWDKPIVSTVLFDTVAVALAFSEKFFRMEDLKLSIDKEGFMRRDENGCNVKVAMECDDMNGFKQFLLDRLT